MSSNGAAAKSLADDIYKDVQVRTLMLQKIKETKSKYYIGTDHVVRIQMQSGWLSYLEAMQWDGRLKDPVIESKVELALESAKGTDLPVSEVYFEVKKKEV